MDFFSVLSNTLVNCITVKSMLIVSHVLSCVYLFYFQSSAGFEILATSTSCSISVVVRGSHTYISLRAGSLLRTVFAHGPCQQEAFHSYRCHDYSTCCLCVAR